jgi:hypothetical protein
MLPVMEPVNMVSEQQVMSPAGKMAASFSPASTASTAASPVAKDKAKTGKENAVMLQLTKTKMCTFFQRGRCASNNCRYAHSSVELRHQPNMQKTKLCKQFLQGDCQDRNCMYAHGEQDLRVTDGIYKTQMCNFFERGYCKKGDRCNHAHGPVDLRPPATAEAPPSAPVPMMMQSTPSTPMPKMGGMSPLGAFDMPSSMRGWRSPLPLTELLVDNEANINAPMSVVPPTPTKSVVELASMSFSPMPSSPLWGYGTGQGLLSPAPGLSSVDHQTLGRYDPVEVLLDQMRANPQQHPTGLTSAAAHTMPPAPPQIGQMGGYPLGLELQRPPMPDAHQLLNWQLEQQHVEHHQHQQHHEWLSPAASMHYGSVPPPPALSPPVFQPSGLESVGMWQSEHAVPRHHDPVAINLSDRLASLDAVVRGLSADIAVMKDRPLTTPASETPVKVRSPAPLTITTGEKRTHKL